MIYFTSDTHFADDRYAKLERPFPTPEVMDATLIENWNTVVGKNDEVWHLGDVTRYLGALKYFDHLNGTVHLVKGNHDSFDDKHYQKHFGEIAQKSAIIEIDGYEFSLSHDPGDAVEGYFALHGHVHDYWREIDGYCNVGVDVWEFTPVSIERIIEVCDI